MKILFAVFIVALTAGSYIRYLVSSHSNKAENGRKLKSSGKLFSALRFLGYRSRLNRAMKTISEKLALNAEGSGWRSGRRWYGTYRGRSISLQYADSFLPSTWAFNIRFVIHAPETAKIVLRIFSADFRWAFLPMYTFSSMTKTGDSVFDNATLISSGIGYKSLALLNKKARENIAALMKDRHIASVNVEHGSIVVMYFGEGEDFPDLIGDSVDLLFDTVEILCRQGSVLTLLKENYLEAANNGIKFRILKELNSLHADLKKNDPVIADALASNDSEIRFEAIRMLGSRGYGMLQDFYRQSPVKMKTRVLNYVNRCGVPGMLPFFLDPANQLKYRGFRLELIKLFTAARSPEAEPWLLDIVRGAVKTDESAVKAAVRGLAFCGGFGAIAELDKIRTRDNARLVDQAIAHIQDRIGVGDTGWLSVESADAENGKLSIDETDSGQLSVKRKKK